MQEGSNAKQLIVEKIKQSANILVTVGANPSVDALAAALGLTLMLNKLDKHATAVFSGVVPPAINFLEPNKTFENNVDSLRDFIIALDKEKADRLRYKVEDDVVRIFITPYRTRISEKDLQFSQGDFNVDLIVALGVEDQKDLDQAIIAHGRILHDATVATINATSQKSSLGSIDWPDGDASSLSEMLASIAEGLKQGILDQQISTALLTGIVAATERFSNQHTTARVMTIAAQLMAAGANQQLIATKLQTIPAPVSPRRERNRPDSQPEQTASDGANGEMHIQHNEPVPAESAAATPQLSPKKAAKPRPSKPRPEPETGLVIAPPAAQAFNDLKQAIAEDTDTVRTAPQREMVGEPATPGSESVNLAESEEEKPEPEQGYLSTHPSWQGREIKPPTMGGTLSATSEQALEDKLRAEEEDRRNHTILTHGGPAQEVAETSSPTPVPASEPEPPQAELSAPAPQPEETPPPSQPAPASSSVETLPELPVAPPPLVVSEPIASAELSPEPQPVSPAPESPAMSPVPPPPVEAPAVTPPRTEPTLEELEREAANHAAQAVAPQTLSELEAARKEPEGAMPAPVTPPASIPPQPLAPAEPVNVGLPPMPPMPDFGALPPATTPTLPPLPPEAPTIPSATPPQPPAPADPGQFQIPGQP